jgi:hypothetical protein
VLPDGEYEEASKIQRTKGHSIDTYEIQLASQVGGPSMPFRGLPSERRTCCGSIERSQPTLSLIENLRILLAFKANHLKIELPMRLKEDVPKDIL